jgi:hypothetical protein
MPLNPASRDGLPEEDQKFLQIIEEHGWHVTMVGLTEGDEGPAWAYSTGLYYRFQHPEIIVFGQKLELMQHMINAVGGRVRAGEKFEPDRGYADIIGNFDCRFFPVDRNYYRDYVGWSLWFYDRDPMSFPMLQCFWPDMEGKFPWEPGCAQWAIDAQPLLYTPT